MLVAAVAAAGCASDEPRSLVLISIDTLRADRLGCYGHPGGLTPRLDALAAEGVVFEDVAAPAPVTLPSHATMFTGRYPTEHGVRNNGTFVLSEAETTLAEVLRSEGWDTAAVIAAFPLHSRFGVAQGFDRYDERLPGLEESRGSGLPTHFPERAAGEVTDRAVGLWRELEGPRRFLWVHYFDPHAPYAPPEPLGGDTPEARYDGEVRWTDRQVGRLLDVVLADDPRAIVAVVSDHGEGLMDHGEMTHGLFLYQSTVAVPWILRAPGRLPAGARFPHPASLADLMPTLLSLVGGAPPAGMQGVALDRALRGGAAPARPVYAEAWVPWLEYRFGELRAIRRGPLKYIDAPAPELYDLARDPGETLNLHGTHPDEEDLALALRDLLEAADADAPRRAAGTLDRAAEARLRSLGYLGGGGPARAADEPRGRDPKTMVAYFQAYDRALGLISSGKIAEGVEALRALGPEAPENYLLRHHVVAGLFALGRLEEAEREIRLAIEAAPEVPRGHQMLGEVLAARGRWPEAVASFRAAAERSPGSGEPLFDMARLMEARGRYREAADAYAEAIGREPGRAGYARALLELYVSRGWVEEAATRFGALAREHPDSPVLWWALAASERRAGRPARALDHLRRALGLDEGLVEALVEVGEIHLDTANLEPASAAFRRALSRQPDHLAARFGIARVLLEQGRPEEADAEFARVLELDPAFAPAHTARGDWLERRGDPAGAAAAYRRALRLNPGDRQAREGLGRVAP